MLLFLKRLLGYHVRWTFQEHILSQLQEKKPCLFLRVEAKWFAMHFGSPWPGLCSLTCSFRLLNLQRKVISTLHMKLLPVMPAISFLPYSPSWSKAYPSFAMQSKTPQGRFSTASRLSMQNFLKFHLSLCCVIRFLEGCLPIRATNTIPTLVLNL